MMYIVNHKTGRHSIVKRRLKQMTLCLIFCIVITAALTACAFSANRHIPAAEHQAVRIERMAGISNEMVAEIQQAADGTTRFFIDHTGMHLTNQVIIVLTTERKAYITEVIARFKVSELEAERVARGTHALSGNNLIIVDMSGIPTVRQKTFLIAHELTHHYQRQLAGNQAGTVKWMLEGMAEEVGAHVVAQQGYFQVKQYKDNWWTGLAMTANKPSLNQLETARDWSMSISQYGSPLTYKTAGLAVLILTEQFGQEKVLDYFAGLGRGENPETSFQKVFGMRMVDFMADFTRSIRKVA